MNKVTNPHDKLFRDTWSNVEVARNFLSHYLPEKVLGIIDLNTLEISKDSFVDKELKDFYSDILYKINLEGKPGYIYLLFEHKSHEEKLIHLQLLEYMLKIWRLHLKQERTNHLPIVIPLVLYHGRRKWSIGTNFSSLLYGPKEVLSEYIPDFKYILYDLSRYSDEEIKGSIIPRVVMLIFKHIFDPDLREKLPGFFSLMHDLLKQDTGLKYLETVLRYLFSTMDNITVDEIKNMVEQSLSEDKGGFIMTLAEQLRDEGYRRGIEEGKELWLQQGMHRGIEIAIKLKFENDADFDKAMPLIRQIKDTSRLKDIEDAIKTSESVSELIDRLSN